MVVTATALRVTADLVELRDFLRKLLGNSYQSEVAPVRVTLRGLAEERKMDLAKVALDLGRQMDHAGHDPSIVFAALVDECESA